MTELERLTPHLRDALLALVDHLEQADGVRPVNDSMLLAIGGQRPATFYVEADAGRITAFAVADHHDEAISVAVDPAHRGRDVAESLLARALDAHPHHTVWAFGTLPGSDALARDLGLVPTRRLMQLGRELTDATPPPVPDGHRLETFTEADASDVVALNALAFADHPEQGRLTVADFRALTQQPWFDARGLLLARHGRDLTGFVWTKRHDEHEAEVYVLAVHPAHGGAGLGRTLLSHGLAHLRATGATRVHLFVEADAERALRLYQSDSFTQMRTDTSYRREAAS